MAPTSQRIGTAVYLPAPENVYAALLEHCDANGLVQISQGQLAQATGHPKHVVAAALVLLLDANLVQRRPRPPSHYNAANVYAIAPPPAPPVALRVVREGDAS